ncbi:syndecan-like isoform X2 [Paramacrobiotus metropolitanus]|uniref:syndecan-like isoform X2 n=1 Tax=Paramacrobiotus metropolitanus TaxID=2943436 RepID=UPI0024464ED9|nr:syndecan-like isoform X2 [Paramacrobiotus metropolitanus]
MLNSVVLSTGTIAVLCGILLSQCGGLRASSGSGVARRGREPAKLTTTTSVARLPLITTTASAVFDDTAADDDYEEEDEEETDMEDLISMETTAASTPAVTLRSTANELVTNSSTPSMLTSTIAPILTTTTVSPRSSVNTTRRDDFNEAAVSIDNDNVQGTGMTGLTLRGHPSDSVEGSGSGPYMGVSDRSRGMMPAMGRADPDAEDDQDVAETDVQIEGSGMGASVAVGGARPTSSVMHIPRGEMDGGRFVVAEGSGTTPRDWIEENTIPPGSYQVFSTPDADNREHIDDDLKNEIENTFRGEVEHKVSTKNTNLLAQPAMLAAVIGGAVVGLLCAILLVMYLIYRMRKKDEGSYALDEPAKRPGGYMRAPTNSGKEYYA